jgi:hypothetical protein
VEVSFDKLKGLTSNIAKKSLLLLVIALLIGVSIGVAVTYEPAQEAEERVTAIASSSNLIVRVNEAINFSSAESTGKIKAYQWKFGDGNQTSEPNPTYTFGAPGWYNVTLTVTDSHDMYTNDTIVVGVQHKDVQVNNDLGTDWELRPRYMKTRWEGGLIGPNIGHPTTDVYCNLDDAYGTFRFRLTLWISMGGGWWTGETIYSEQVVGQGSVAFLYTIDPEECPEGVNDCEIEVELNLEIREGFFMSGEMGFGAEFPMDGVAPPW